MVVALIVLILVSALMYLALIPNYCEGRERSRWETYFDHILDEENDGSDQR